jgi:cytoskeletal protein CcmA (bactofilin family)
MAERDSAVLGAAVLGKGLQVRGRVRGDGDLHVDAQIDGDVSVSGALELGEDGSLSGSLSAASALIRGSLDGEVDVSGHLVISASGSVRGDVRAAELTLDEGGSFEGSIEAEFDLPEAIA